jgi:hypothetical protein
MDEKGEPKDMDFTFSEPEDILLKEERERERKMSLGIWPEKEVKLTSKTLNRLAQPKRKVIPKAKQKTEEELKWEAQHEKNKFAADPTLPPRGGSPQARTPGQVHDADEGGLSPRNSSPRLSGPVGSMIWAKKHHGAGEVYRYQPEGQNASTPGRAQPAGMASPPERGHKQEGKTILSNPVDYAFIRLISPGRVDHVAVDRKTLLISIVADLRLALGGHLYYNSMLVHSHATSTTLGLRHGPESINTLKYAFRIEDEEEVARADLVSAQVASWSNAISSLIVTLGSETAGPTLSFLDAGNTFVDPYAQSSPRSWGQRAQIGRTPPGRTRAAASFVDAHPYDPPADAIFVPDDDQPHWKSADAYRGGSPVPSSTSGFLDADLVGYRHVDGRTAGEARRQNQQQLYSNLQQYGYNISPAAMAANPTAKPAAGHSPSKQRPQPSSWAPPTGSNPVFADGTTYEELWAEAMEVYEEF